MRLEKARFAKYCNTGFILFTSLFIFWKQ